MSKQQLKGFLNNVLERKNETINTIYNDSKYEKQLKTMVEDLEITEQSFECILRRIATTVLSNSKNNGCFVSLLLFSIELNTFHSTYSTWYRRDMLVEMLYDIFLKSNNQYNICKLERFNFWQYTLFLFFCSIIVILF